MGVSEVAWPGKPAGAETLFERMPPTLDGAQVRRPRIFGGAAGVVHGRGTQAPTAWVMEAGTDVPDAPESRYGVPDLDFDGTYRLGGDPWWFACTIDGAEGDPGFTGYALGWASGDLGWLTITPDRATTRSLVDALLRAR